MSAVGFITPLDVRQLIDDETKQESWILLFPSTYTSKNGEEITAPEGFHTDFYSVPDCLAGLVISVDKKPAVLHDYLYRSGMIAGKVITRKKADDLLLEAMIICGFGATRRNTIYYGTRAFGGAAWRRYRDRSFNKTLIRRIKV